jgi:hypothetical protein
MTDNERLTKESLSKMRLSSMVHCVMEYGYPGLLAMYTRELLDMVYNRVCNHAALRLDRVDDPIRMTLQDIAWLWISHKLPVFYHWLIQRAGKRGKWGSEELQRIRYESEPVFVRIAGRLYMLVEIRGS